MSEPETRDDADSAVSLARDARRSLSIANLIAAELPDAVDEITRHLREGWTQLSRLRARQSGDGERVAEASAGFEIDPDFLPEHERERFRSSMRKLMEPNGPTPTLDELNRNARWLTLALTPAERQARKRAGLPHPARRLVLAVAGVIALVGAIMTGGIAWQRIVTGPAPWRVTLYAKEDFGGRTVTRMHDAIDFRWANNRPVFRIPNDHFSVRAETCLPLDERTRLGFALLSDDGSRLFINGNKAIDNWGIHGEETKIATFVLEPGVHHLMVEFFDRTENARLKLSIDDTDGTPIPRSWLRPPSGKTGSATPCGP